MRPYLPILCTLLGVGLSRQASAQSVLIHHAAPADVVDLLKADLIPQGFKLENASEKSALFTLDRGNVIQRDGRIVHVVIELRRAVESQVERSSLQRLLEKVRADIEARPVPRDSSAKRDSTRL